MIQYSNLLTKTEVSLPHQILLVLIWYLLCIVFLMYYCNEKNWNSILSY